MEIFPLPVDVDTIPPLRFTPCDAVLLAPPVPFKVTPPPPEVLIVPPVREIPWLAPLLPVAVAVMLIELVAPVTEKLEPVVKPTPPLPFPVMEEVAVTDPAAVKVAPKLIPLPPEALPVQFEKTTGPLVTKAAAPEFTPWPEPPEPPVQPVNVTVPDVLVVQADAIDTPYAEAAVAVLVPVKVIVPVPLLMIPLVTAILTPNPTPDPARALPVMEIFPPPVDAEIRPVPLRFTPCEAVLLTPPVPCKENVPPPLVLNVPAVIEIP